MGIESGISHELTFPLAQGANALAWAGYHAGAEVYFRGDYETPLKECLLLAEQGDAPAQKHQL